MLPLAFQGRADSLILRNVCYWLNSFCACSHRVRTKPPLLRSKQNVQRYNLLVRHILHSDSLERLRRLLLARP
jgi:hypothetical protein